MKIFFFFVFLLSFLAWLVSAYFLSALWPHNALYCSTSEKVIFVSMYVFWVWVGYFYIFFCFLFRLQWFRFFYIGLVAYFCGICSAIMCVCVCWGRGELFCWSWISFCWSSWIFAAFVFFCLFWVNVFRPTLYQFSCVILLHSTSWLCLCMCVLWGRGWLNRPNSLVLIYFWFFWLFFVFFFWL